MVGRTEMRTTMINSHLAVRYKLEGKEQGSTAVVPGNTVVFAVVWVKANFVSASMSSGLVR